MVYQMLSGGVLPYRGDANIPGASVKERYEWEHCFLPLPPLSQFNPAVYRGVEAVVQQALSKSPSDRFPSVLDFYAAFEQAHLETQATLPAKSPVATERVQRAQRPPTIEEQAPSPKRGTSYLYVRSGELAGRSIPILEGNELTIGRDPTCKLRFNERSVSRNHAVVYATQRGLFIRDEGSSLGTYLNNKRLNPNVPKPLGNGDIIQTGYYQTFEIRLNPPLEAGQG
jgi:hypothetical protein